MSRARPDLAIKHAILRIDREVDKLITRRRALEGAAKALSGHTTKKRVAKKGAARRGRRGGGKSGGSSP